MTKDMTNGNPMKLILGFALPMLLGYLFQQCYNLVDTMIVGRYLGVDALAAVGSTGSINFLVIGFCMGVCAGFTIPVSQKFGAGDYVALRKYVANCVYLGAGFAAIISFLTVTFCRDILELMNTPADIIEGAYAYIVVIFIGIPLAFLYNILAGIIRALGDSRTPVIFLLISSVINICLDLVFIINFNMGVAGAAIATLISQAVSAVLTLACLIRTNESCKLYLKKITIKKDHLARIMKIGIPIGIQSATYNLANLLIQSSINDFGTDTIAAWGAYWKMDVFWMVMSAFSIALTTFVGQNYGASLYDRIRKGVRSTLWMAHLTSIVICGAYILFAEFLFSLFSSDAAVIDTGVRMLYFLMPTYITYVCTEVLSGALRAMGDTFMPMLLSCGGVCAIRVIWTGFIYPMNPTIEMLELNYPVSWIITSVLFVIYYLWKRKKLMPDL